MSDYDGLQSDTTDLALGELVTDNLNPFKNLQDFQHLTIDKLNLSHHVNQKPVSISHFIKEAE